MKRISLLLVIMLLFSSVNSLAKLRIYKGEDELTKSEGTNFKVETVDGIGGKSKLDKVYKINGKSTTASSNYIDPYLRAFKSSGSVEYSLLFEDSASIHTVSLVNQNSEGNAADGYLNNIFKFSPEYDHIKYNSNNFDKVANSGSFKFETGKWYRIAIDYTYNTDSTYGNFDLYVNGNKIGTVKYESPYGVRRLALGCSEKSDNTSSIIYMDNITSYKETDEDFTPAKTSPSEITLVADEICLSDGVYVLPSNYSVQDFKNSITTRNTDDVVRVFDLSLLNELSNTDIIRDAIIVVASLNGRDYETAYIYNTVHADASNEPALESSVYDLSGETITIMPYTTLEAFMLNVTLKSSCVITASNNGQIYTSSDILTAGSIITVSDLNSGDVLDTYNIAVKEKSISDNFDSQSQKMYSGGTTTDGNYTFSGPTLNAGYSPADYAYIEAIEIPGKGKVIHSYSNGSHSAESGYKHMNLMGKSSKTNKSALGTKFAFHVQVMLPKSNDTYKMLAKYKTDDGTEKINQEVFKLEDGSISFFGKTISVYEIGKWTDIFLLCDSESGKVISYINNSFASEVIIESFKDFDYFTQLRPIHHNYQSGKIVESYLACYEVFGIGSMCEQIIYDNNTKLASSVYTVSDKTINGFIGMFASDIKLSSNIANGASLTIHTSSGIEVSDATKIQKGMLVVVKSKSCAVEDVYTFGAEHCEVGDIQILVNGGVNYEKFVSGTITAQIEAENYCNAIYPITIAIAHYSDKTMTGMNFTSANLTKGKHKLSVDLEITDTKDTHIKAFVFDSISNIIPLKEEFTMESFSSDSIEDVRIFYPGYVEKAVTFSYDDLVSYDKKLISIFNENGIKGTFNLMTNRFADYDNSVLLNTYAGHEIASHTYSHPRIYINKTTDDEYLTYEEAIADIQKAQDDIKNLTGYAPIGFAWPYARASSRSDYQEMLAYMHDAGIRYTRSVTDSHSFELPDDWMEWDPTCHHDEASEYTQEFINLKNDGNLKLLYIWGHSYEFVTSNVMNWDGITAVCKILGSDNTIWKATNEDIYNYIEATKLVVTDYENGTITNNSSLDIYLAVNSVNITIPAKSQFTIK